MIWYQLLAVFAAIVCISSCLLHAIRLIRLGPPVDYSQSIGSTGDAIRYSITGAMSPIKKESAFMHLPTYTAGILYHMGTFLSFFLFILFLAEIYPKGILSYAIIAVLVVSGLSGFGILLKRMSKVQLRTLSNPDDYISNLLVSIVQLLTALVLIRPETAVIYFVVISIFLLYLPLGKLKHVVYFFAARYHLGFFYGWRGVWPPKKG